MEAEEEEKQQNKQTVRGYEEPCRWGVIRQGSGTSNRIRSVQCKQEGFSYRALSAAKLLEGVTIKF